MAAFDAPKGIGARRVSRSIMSLIDAAARERSISDFAESSDCETSFVALISRRGAFVVFVRVYWRGSLRYYERSSRAKSTLCLPKV